MNTLLGIVVRWALPLLVSAVVGWAGINKVTGMFSKAARAKVLQQEIDDLKIKHANQIGALNNHFGKKIKEALSIGEEKAAESDERREHWRQSYYKERDEHDNSKRQFEEETRLWASRNYPAELD